jgi:peptide/nickel transport system permease protein
VSTSIPEVEVLVAAPGTSGLRASGLRKTVMRHPAAIAGGVILAFFILIALLAPWIEPYGLRRNVGPVFAAPSARHWLGLDDAGVDVVSLLIAGTRSSLLIGFAAALVSTFVGGAVGVVAGYFGGVTDGILMRVTDYFLVIPDLPLMIIVAAIWGQSVWHIILVIGLLHWTWTARTIRAQVKSIRERTYMRRVRSLGAGHRRAIVHHLLPQVAPLLLAVGVRAVANSIFAAAALAFLGLGDPTAISWGGMIQHAFERSAVSSGAWWAVVPPGLCIALVVVACYLLGQAIADILNPRTRSLHLSARRFGVLPLTVSSRQQR